MKTDFKLEIASTVTDKTESGNKEFIRLMLDVTTGDHTFVILDIYGNVIFSDTSFKTVATKFWDMEIK